jgi:hypothetical protein
VPQGITGQPVAFGRFIHINSKEGLTGPDLFGLDTGQIFIHSAFFAEIAVPDGKGQRVSVQEGPALYFQAGPAHIPAVMGMDEKNILIGFDHLKPLFKGGPPLSAFKALAVMVFTSPAAFQKGPDIKYHVLWCDEFGMKHFQLQSKFDVGLHFILPPRVSVKLFFNVFY